MKNQSIGRVEFLKILQHKVTAKDLATIQDAYSLSKYGHRNQVRDEGIRYFEHPKSVALILVNELNVFEKDLIVMALLHDILEDTHIISCESIRKLFGKRVFAGLDFLTRKDTAKKYLERFKSCDDLGVLVVKLSDRLHNLRTLTKLKPEKKKKYIKETKDYYFPLINFITENSQRFKYISTIKTIEQKIKNIIELEKS